MGTLIVTNSHISCAEKTIMDSRQVWGTRDERSGFGVLFFFLLLLLKAGVMKRATVDGQNPS